MLHAACNLQEIDYLISEVLKEMKKYSNKYIRLHKFICHVEGVKGSVHIH